MGSLPPEIVEACVPIAIGMALFWLVQPLVFRCFLVHQTLPWRLAAALWYGATMYYLAHALREALGEYYSFNVNLIWWVYALISVKYVHAVLSPTFGAELGLTSWSRIALFCYLPATVIFDSKPSSTQQQPGHSALFYLARGLVQLVVMGQVAQTVLAYRLDEQLPLWAHSLVAYYQIMLSQGGFADVAFSAPTRMIVGPRVRIEEPSDAPALATVPRYFWARWSKCAGYHLRTAIYERWGGRRNQWTATAATFGLNCVLHITWWGYVSAGKLAWNYIPLLFTIPLTNLWLDKYLLVPYVKHYSVALYHTIGWLVLQAMVVYAMPHFLDAQGLPKTLHELCLLQSGRL